MEQTSKQIKIVLTGPESTGKSTLTKQLADHFRASYTTEVLREFANKKPRIEQADMPIIAKLQLEAEQKATGNLVFLDTNIVTLFIYHQYYFNSNPEWFLPLYNSQSYLHYLLLDTSIEWEYDVQRDSPQAREFLFTTFKNTLDQLNVSYSLITGTGSQRLTQAIHCTKKALTFTYRTPTK